LWLLLRLLQLQQHLPHLLLQVQLLAVCCCCC
jgi:hypothetical protein